jgi:hapalindole H/12-epi-hapalindole U/12-epi-fischerindole U synthase
MPIRILRNATLPALFLLFGCDDPQDPATGGTAGSAGSGAGGSSSAGSAGSSGSSAGGSGAGGSSAGGSSGQGGSAGSPAGGSSGAAGTGGSGSPVTIENPGFEADPVAAGKYNDKIVPASWSKYDPGAIIGLDYNSLGVLNPTGTVLYPAGAPEGSNVALIFLWRDQTAGTPAGISQVLSEPLMTNTLYTLRVRVGNIAPEVAADYDLNGFPGYRVELLAGGEVLAADDNTLLPGEGKFLQSEVSFTSGPNHPKAGESLEVRLLNLNMADPGIEVNFDDVRLDAVPIPL